MLPTQSQAISRKLSGKPTMPLTYQAASRQFGGPMAAILDRLAASKTPASKAMASSPEKIKWELVVDRADDPRESIHDYEAIRSYYAANSHIYLKAIAGLGVGGKSIHFEELHAAPDAVMALFEQRAKLVADRRNEAREEAHAMIVTDIPDANQNGKPQWMYDLDRWLHAHPKKEVAYLARRAIEMLMEH